MMIDLTGQQFGNYRLIKLLGGLSVAPINAVAWSPDGNHLASASLDTTVHVWDAHSGSLLHTYTGHSSIVNAVAWSPDGSRLASGADNGVVAVWQAV